MRGLRHRPRLQLQTPEQIKLMRQAGLVVATALAQVSSLLQPGTSARELDAAAEEIIRQAGAVPSFLGYQGYPATICLSINDVVVHGIPRQQVLASGDLVSIDCGAILDGWHGDAAISQVVGPGDEATGRLNQVTETAMWDGIAAMASGSHVGDIGAAIEYSVRGAGGDFGILEDYVGHGIGRAMHQPPDVPNYRAKSRGPRLEPGLCLAIEPMVVAGGIATCVEDDQWTVRTLDGKVAAHWEHTVARTEGGIWVLTALDGGAAQLAARGVEIAPA